jgi:AAHS family 4-hydroxybenzoate transporter-like MFS transporter
VAQPNELDVNKFLDTRRVGRTHLLVVSLLILTMMVDGYDIFVMGIVAPYLASDLAIPPESLTSVLVVTQLGLMLGNFVVGPVADRHGRRFTMLWCLVLFGLLTLATPLATTVTELFALRFVAGLFLSGVIPNAIALVAEIMPGHVRATFVSITFAGYTLGTSVIGAPVVKWLVPIGWEYAFVVGGVLPLVLSAVLYFTLPESLRFLANRRPHDPRIPRQLKRMDATLALTGSETFVMRGNAAAGQAPVAELFRDGRWVITLLLWTGFHMAFIVSNLLGSWRNVVLNQNGLTTDEIATIMFLPGIAGVIGTLTSGFVMERLGPTRVLPVYLGMASLSTAAVAFFDLTSIWTLLAFIATGYFSNGGLSGINALASITYPSQMRATGVSFAHSAGRAGAIVGPFIGGAMIAAQLSAAGVFLITAIPQMCAALAIFVMWRVQAQRAPVPALAPKQVPLP